MNETTPTSLLSDKSYKFLKWCVQIVMPAFSSLYFGLTQTFDFLPSAEVVIGTIALLTTFFGVILGISTKSYNSSSDGELVVTNREDGTKLFTLELHVDPNELLDKNNVVFKVK
jgi:hypothetical protein